MIYAVVDKETNIVIGCDMNTPINYLNKIHPENTFFVPIEKTNSAVKVGYFWDEQKKIFYPLEGKEENE